MLWKLRTGVASAGAAGAALVLFPPPFAGIVAGVLLFFGVGAVFFLCPVLLSAVSVSDSPAGLTVRSGRLFTVSRSVPRRHLLAASLVQTPLARRLGVGAVRFSLPQGALWLPELPLAVCRRLMALCREE